MPRFTGRLASLCWSVPILLLAFSNDTRAASLRVLDEEPESSSVARTAPGPSSALILRERASVVHVDALRAAAESGGTVVFNLFRDVQIGVRFTKIEVRSATDFSWFGKVEGEPLGDALLTVSDGRVSGNIWIPGGVIYEIRSVAGAEHAIRELSSGGYPKESCAREVISPANLEPIAEAPVAPAGVDATCGPAVLTDVLVVWTAAAKTKDPNMTTTIQQAIDDANASYTNSGINQKLRLVHAEEISYTESGDIENDRNRLRDTSDGYMDGVHALRDTYGADLVALMISDDPDACGIAFIQESVGAAFASSAFAAVVTGCAVGNHSFAHELGHNMGARHDRYVDDTDGSPYDYNHGFVYKPAKWRTVMAYNDDCKDDGFDCTRLQFWSNPDLQNNSIAMGVAEGDSEAADNRKALNNTESTTGAFRGRKMPWADGGSDIQRECVDPDGQEVTDIQLNGNLSCDPNDDALTYAWTGSFVGAPASGATPTVGFSLGTTQVTLKVNDGVIDSLTDTLSVEVEDTTDPTGGITYPAADQCISGTVTIQDDFTDTCDGTLTRTYSPGNGTYTAQGNFTVTAYAEDGSGNSTDDSVSFVIDTTPPTVTLKPVAPLPIKVDRNLTYPLSNGFTSGDADTGAGGVVHEEMLIDGCVVLDGNVYGDGDGLLLDETISFSRPFVCAAWALCGKSLFVNPVISVRVTDCAGNTATDSKVSTGIWAISGPICN